MTCRHLPHVTFRIQIRPQIIDARPLGGNGVKKRREPQMTLLSRIIRGDLKPQRIHIGPCGGEAGVSRMCIP